MAFRNAAILVLTASLPSCGSCCFTFAEAEESSWRKITFDVDKLDADGLHGPPNGRRALSYEFCVPDTNECRDQVASIDATVQFMPGSSGQIGYVEGQCLCIGSTNQDDWSQVLGRLAALEYVQQINECFFE